MWARIAAGWAIIAAGTGLAAISGYLAYQGFDAMIDIPFIGWIGPCVALSLIGLGIAIESEIRFRRWPQVAILGVILAGGALLDRHSGELALIEKVNASHQAGADRQAAYDEAVKAKSSAEDLIEKLEAELAIMTGDDIRAAQLKLASLGLYSGRIDGARGPVTLDAMRARGSEIRKDLTKARATADAASGVIARGAPVSEAPFSLKDAEIYATMVTLLSIILAFVGSYVAHGLQRNPDDELAEIEAQTTEFETELFSLADFLADRKKAAMAAA